MHSDTDNEKKAQIDPLTEDEAMLKVESLMKK